jgi:hypothetical protein
MEQNTKGLADYDKAAIAEYFAKGGEVTVCKPHARTENIEYTGGAWGKRKKKVPPPPPVPPVPQGDKT